jgi:hypothetical protein
MAGFKITAVIGRAIKAAKAAGRSDRAIAQEIAEQHGVSISHRAVGQYLKKTSARAAPTGVAPRPMRSEPASHRTASSALDEIETLQARIQDLNDRLSDPDVEPRLIAPLNAELRQTFASIRKADKARTEAKARASGDTAWVVAKLRRFVSMNGTGGAAAKDDTDDDAELPATAGPASG